MRNVFETRPKIIETGHTLLLRFVLCVAGFIWQVQNVVKMKE